MSGCACLFTYIFVVSRCCKRFSARYYAPLLCVDEDNRTNKFFPGDIVFGHFMWLWGLYYANLDGLFLRCLGLKIRSFENLFDLRVFGVGSF